MIVTRRISDRDVFERYYSELGRRLLGKYEVFGVKEGGFGLVYFVSHVEDGAEYAIKVPKRGSGASAKDGFKAELAVWFSLEPHENIVRPHLVEEIDGHPCLIMEYVDGGRRTSLREWLQEDDGTAWAGISSQAAAEFAYQLCLGMHAAGAQGEFVHADLKPENLLISKDSVLKITDFGLAYRLRMQDDGRYLRISAGTWPYSAPELFEGEVLDSRSDIYAAGMIVYEMLTGCLPLPIKWTDDSGRIYLQLKEFYAGRPEWHHLLHEKIADARWRSILEGCLVVRREDRWPNFSDLGEAIQHRFQPRWTPAADSKLTAAQLHARAVGLMKGGSYSEALSIFNRLLSLNSVDLPLWSDAAEALAGTGDYLGARELLERGKSIVAAAEAKQSRGRKSDGQ